MKSIRMWKKAVAILPVMFSLMSCGGGGGGSSQASVEFPVESVFSSFFTKSSTYTLRAKDTDANNYVLTVSTIPGPDKTDSRISSGARKTVRQNTSLTVNTAAPIEERAEVFFTVSPFTLAGYINEDGEIFRAMQTGALPRVARVGESGLLVSGTLNDGSTTSTLTINWSLEGDSNSAAWLCLTHRDSNDPLIAKGCTRIDQSGAESGRKLDLTAPNLSLQFR